MPRGRREEMQRSQVDFDFSTPEGLRALEYALDIVMEIRQEVSARTVLYERTLGLAVVPVLLRRAAIRVIHRGNGGKPL